MSRNPNKQPIIGKDRLAILNRNQGISGNGHTRSASVDPKTRISPLPNLVTDIEAGPREEQQ